jgi:hypothetical protein
MSFFFVFVILSLLHCCCSEGELEVEKEVWAVRLLEDTDAEEFAQKWGLINEGRIGNLEGYYAFTFENGGETMQKRNDEESNEEDDFIQRLLLNRNRKKKSERKRTETKEEYENSIEEILWFQKQIPKIREKRFNKPIDPAYDHQWHLHELHFEEVWSLGYTGVGVVVAVVDDGVEGLNKDLEQNFNRNDSYDVFRNKNDPTPLHATDIHGTAAAGVIAAVSNDVCGVGVAPNASIAGLRLLGGRVTDHLEANALSYHTDQIDIFSASWGPSDDGKRIEGPGEKWLFVIGRKRFSLFTLHSSLFTLHSSLFTLHSSLFTLHSSLFSLLSSLFSLLSSLFTLHSSLFTLHSSLFTLHSSLFTLHSSLFTLHSSLFTLHSSLFHSIYVHITRLHLT